MSDLNLDALGAPPSPEPETRGFFRRHSILVSIVALMLAFSWYLAYLTVSLPDVEHLRTRHPQSTSLMAQRSSEARGRGSEPRRVQYWVPLEQISERLIQAVIMGEDGAFYAHPGFDFFEIRESLWKNWERRGFARGASTITQQLAKNLYLSTEKSLHRKLKEVILTLRLERALSKNRILEIYLNVIEWGDGIYGAEAAARTYFRKPAAQLNAAEAALLAAMIPNPRRLNPATRLEAVKVHQERILRWMWRAGRLSDEEYRAAVEEELHIWGGT